MNAFAKRIIWYGAVVVASIGVFFLARQPIANYTTHVLTFIKEYSAAHDDVLNELRQEIFSAPLRKNSGGETAALSSLEIIRLTNTERAAENLLALKENTLLDAAANRKLQDMFDQQYFEHISPEGFGPGFLADTVGYAYVVVGENLALGSFKSNRDLLQAWMASPGHRENILNVRYLDIGVAVGYGIFNGEKVWLAVQEFGKSASTCPLVSSDLRSQIEKDKSLIIEIANDIKAFRAGLDALPNTTAEENLVYNAKVSEYNLAVNGYNSASVKLKKEIDDYNQSVINFNTCARQ